VRLAERQRHVVEQLHLRRGHVDQLEVLRQQRADRREPVERPLVHRDQVLAVGADGVALGRGEVADVVVGRDLVDHLQVLERPLGDDRLDEHRGVGEALAVELVCSGPRPSSTWPRIDSLKSRIGTP
jgi:hypothetical protein